MNGYGGYEEGNKRGTGRRPAGLNREAMPARRSPERTSAGNGQRRENVQRRSEGTVINYEQLRADTVRGRNDSSARMKSGQTSRQTDAASGRDYVQAAVNRRQQSEKTQVRQTPTRNVKNSSKNIRTSKNYGRSGGQYTGTEDRARARAKARKRKWRKQRRMLLGGILCLILLFVGIGVYGVVRSRRIDREKQERLEAGILLLDSGNYEGAIAKLDEALQWSKKTVGAFEKDVLMYRAEAEYRLEDYDAAMHTYELLKDADPENVDYKTGVAYCLLAKGDEDSALALDVIDGYVYNHIAVRQIQAKEYDLALENIEKGLAAGGGDAMRLLSYNQAVAWEGKGDFAKALELYEAYVARYGSEKNAELENAERELAFLKTRQGEESLEESQEDNQEENEESQIESEETV